MQISEYSEQAILQNIQFNRWLNEDFDCVDSQSNKKTGRQVDRERERERERECFIDTELEI